VALGFMNTYSSWSDYGPGNGFCWAILVGFAVYFFLLFFSAGGG